MDHNAVATLTTLQHDADDTRRKLSDILDDEAAALYRMNPASERFERRDYAASILRDAVEALDRAADLIRAARDA